MQQMRVNEVTLNTTNEREAKTTARAQVGPRRRAGSRDGNRVGGGATR